MPNSRKKRREAWTQVIENRINEAYDRLKALGYVRYGPWGRSKDEYTPEQAAVLAEITELNKQLREVKAESDQRPKRVVAWKQRSGSTHSRRKGQPCSGKKPKFIRSHSTWVSGSHKLPNPTSNRVSLSYGHGRVTAHIEYPASYFVTEEGLPLAEVIYDVARDSLSTTLPFRDERQHQAYLNACKRLVPKQPAPVFHPKRGDRPGRPIEVWQQAKEATR